MLRPLVGHLEVLNHGAFLSQLEMVVLHAGAAAKYPHLLVFFNGRHNEGSPERTLVGTVGANLIARNLHDGGHALVHFGRRLGRRHGTFTPLLLSFGSVD